MTLLAIDIGNTRLKWAQYAVLAAGAEPLAHGAVFLETIDQLADAGGAWTALMPP
nr:type III pantothenate kinase [Methylibium sp.]